jgi:hypothetical protein
MATRAEHLKWCKERANEYLELGDKNQAFTSFMSNMSKHEETANHMALGMGTMLLVTGNLSTTHEMKNWIDGFN